MDLSNGVAIVTGSGRGIGRAIALKLAEVGATVVVNDIGDAQPVEAVTQEIRAMGRQSLPVLADVSSSSDVARLKLSTSTRANKILKIFFFNLLLLSSIFLYQSVFPYRLCS